MAGQNSQAVSSLEVNNLYGMITTTRKVTAVIQRGKIKTKKTKKKNKKVTASEE